MPRERKLSNFLLVTVLFVWIEASPLPAKHTTVDVSRISKPAKVYGIVDLALREKRSFDYPYGHYDIFPPYNEYYSAPSYYPDEYYNALPPPVHRPSYYGNANNLLEAGYSLDYKKTHKRRRYRPDRFEATSQKHTIWDLARK